MSETNVELARRGYEAALRGDTEALRQLLDPAVKWHGGDPSDPEACQNRVQAIEFMRAAGRRPRGELVEVIDAGDRVVLIMQVATDQPEPPVRVANVATFRDGKVIEMVHYPDASDALAAAGVKTG